MENPFFNHRSLAASGSIKSSPVNLVGTRTLSITTEVLFGASIDADALVYAYYSPDGNNWDTIAFTSWAITFTVSTRVRKTVLVDVPEHGFILFKITNGSAADTINDVKLWKSIGSYPKE